MAYIYDLTDTWSAGGTTFNAIKMNVTDSASAAGSKLVTLQTNGTEHFSVTKAGVGYFSGNVGIGTASPQQKLQVSGGRIRVSSDNVNGGDIAVDSTGLAFSTLSTTQPIVFLRNNYASESMRITSAGNVGIGTSSPATQLHLAGSADIRMTNTANTAGFDVGLLGGSADANAYVYQRGGAALVFGTANTERMRITSGGQLLSGTTTAVNAGGVFSTAGAAVSTTVTKNSNMTGMTLVATDNVNTMTGLWFGTGNGSHWSGIAGGRTDHVSHWGTHLSFYTHADDFTAPDNANERMRITGAGNVGIGTSSPTELLDVNSDAIRIRTAQTPASATAAGNAGDICWDSNYVYVCVATNTWKRSALSTW